MEGWNGLMSAKPQGYVWPVPLATPPPSCVAGVQALGPWFWPPNTAAGSVTGLAPTPILAPSPVPATPSALPKQTTITEADVGKVAYEMTYAPNPSPGFGGPPVVQTTRETTITAADVGKWAFEMPDSAPFGGAPNPGPSFPFNNMAASLSAGNKSESRWYESNRRHTGTKIFKDKSTQKYLVFDKHTQTDPHRNAAVSTSQKTTQWRKY